MRLPLNPCFETERLVISCVEIFTDLMYGGSGAGGCYRTAGLMGEGNIAASAHELGSYRIGSVEKSTVEREEYCSWS